MNEYLHICCVLQLLNQLYCRVQVSSYGIHGSFLFCCNLLHLSAQGRMACFDRRQVLQQLNRVSLKSTTTDLEKQTQSLFKMNKCIQTYLKRARFTHICHEVKFQPLFHIFYISFCFLELQRHGSKHHHSVSIQKIWVRSWLPFIGVSIYWPIWTRVRSKTWNPISNIALLWTQWTAEAILIGSQELGLDITTCKTEKTNNNMPTEMVHLFEKL